jgi:hypothetical protein
MHLLQIRDHRDLHLDDLDRRDVELHQLMDRLNDMDLMLMHLLLLDEVQNLDDLDHLHPQDVVHLDVQQNLDVVRLVVEHLDVQHPSDVVVDAELRHQLRTDYFLDEVDVELPRLPRMDCFLDEVQLVHQVLEQLVLLEQLVNQELLRWPQLQLLALLHVML